MDTFWSKTEIRILKSKIKENGINEKILSESLPRKTYKCII